MNASVWLALFLMAIIAALASPLSVHAQSHPTFVEGKFVVPLDREVVKQEWKRLGYSSCRYEGKAKDWTKGEHTHAWYILFAGKIGKMEFIINDRRFVLEPGDELFYPKDAIMTASNLFDGRSEWFACSKYQ